MADEPDTIITLPDAIHPHEFGGSSFANRAASQHPQLLPNVGPSEPAVTVPRFRLFSSAWDLSETERGKRVTYLPVDEGRVPEAGHNRREALASTGKAGAGLEVAPDLAAGATQRCKNACVVGPWVAAAITER